MRFLSICAVCLATLGTPAFALGAGDTMRDWGAASSQDKDAVLRTLDGAGGDAARNRIRSCLDTTALTAGHSNLPISEVAKACSEQSARENI
ncbi:hypothetical protein [Methylobacterium komagatae]